MCALQASAKSLKHPREPVEHPKLTATSHSMPPPSPVPAGPPGPRTPTTTREPSTDLLALSYGELGADAASMSRWK